MLISISLGSADDTGNSLCDGAISHNPSSIAYDIAQITPPRTAEVSNFEF
jgi:hypothetical protein